MVGNVWLPHIGCLSPEKLDFAGDFVDMLKDDDISLEDKRDEIHGYKQVFFFLFDSTMCAANALSFVETQVRHATVERSHARLSEP